MCGIVGYIGQRSAVPILVRGLQRLEYRGYDSAGICIPENGKLYRARCKGTIQVLANEFEVNGWMAAQAGMGHTRWATHGIPSDWNAHPLASEDESVMVVHNGIIENYVDLRDMLKADGYEFSSETDTEAVAHLIHKEYQGDLMKAVMSTLRQVRGTYGLVVMHADHPEELIAARRGSPMVLGVGDGEMLVASDVSAFLKLTDKVVYLEDQDTRLTPCQEILTSRLSARLSK
jgi:glutamine---fructose-6-phosphate transaminase (isomerizing)